METKQLIPAFDLATLDWSHPSVQGCVCNHLRNWGTKLFRRGVDRDDIKQELALVFLRTKEKFEDVQTLHRFLAFLAANFHRRLIDLNRMNNSCGRNLEVTASSIANDDSDDILAMVPGRPDADAGMIDLDTAPQEVRDFLAELNRMGLQTVDESGKFLPLSQFCLRATGRPWSAVRPLVQRWATKLSLPA